MFTKHFLVKAYFFKICCVETAIFKISTNCPWRILRIAGLFYGISISVVDTEKKTKCQAWTDKGTHLLNTRVILESGISENWVKRRQRHLNQCISYILQLTNNDTPISKWEFWCELGHCLKNISSWVWCLRFARKLKTRLCSLISYVLDKVQGPTSTRDLQVRMTLR